MVELLRCCTQSYAWGRKGTSSEVGRLKSSSDADFTLENDKPYAELWMGTHPSGPSYVSLSTSDDSNGSSNSVQLLLSDYLRDKPQLVGTVPPGYPANDLPFLFKVLSVQTALSIQVSVLFDMIVLSNMISMLCWIVNSRILIRLLRQSCIKTIPSITRIPTISQRWW
jgi:mannose-6-phosphate isomerase class I